MDPKVVGLVYVAAFAPDAGEQVGELGKKYPPPPALASPIVDEKGFLTLSVDAFKKFGSDLPESDAALACATQGPINSASFGAQVTGVAWKTKPSWYAVSTLDQAIAPDEERFFAKRMKATTTELKASHVSLVSQPKAVAAIIMDAAEKAQAAATTAAH
jgi:pimeloyl-ACP methyl ester carboxylesterase